MRFKRANPDNVIIIKTDDPTDSFEKLKNLLGETGYIKNLLIDYHANTFGENCRVEDPEVLNGMKDLAKSGFIGLGSQIYLGQCWAGGSEKFKQGNTQAYCKASDGATTYGGKTEAYSAGFKIFGDFGRMGWTLNFDDGGKPESDKPFHRQRGVAFYSSKLQKIVSMDISDDVVFKKDGSIHNKSTKTLDQNYEKYEKKKAKATKNP
jgi:hypothetical protein